MATVTRIARLVLVLMPACAAPGSTQPMLQERAAERGIHEREVRAELLDYVRLFDQAVAGTADAIASESDDPEIRRHAILWKILAVPGCQAAAFQESPTLGLVDVWAMALQMDAFFRSGEGKERFGSYQPRVTATCRRLADAAGAFTRLLPGDDPASMRERLEAWVAAHPITDGGRVRPSPMSEVSRLVAPRDLSAVAALVSMEQHVADLSLRLGLYAESMPRQVRWQGELMTEQVFQREKFRASMADFAVMAASLEELAGYEAVAREQLDRAVGRMDALAGDVLASADAQRIETLAAISKERETILADAERQRVETLAALSREREAIVETANETRAAVEELVRTERARTISDAERIVGETMERGDAQARGLIDHLFLRVVQAGAALIGLTLVAALIYRLTSSRGSSPP